MDCLKLSQPFDLKEGCKPRAFLRRLTSELTGRVASPIHASLADESPAIRAPVERVITPPSAYVQQF